MPRAQTRGGREINPMEGVVPVMLETPPGRLRIVGTAFYITRYGLFASVSHVLRELAVDGKTLGTAYICHHTPDRSVHLRQILSAALLDGHDVAVGQAQNFMEEFPNDPLTNLQAPLSLEIPQIGAPLATYAYPENDTLDFTDGATVPTIKGDYYQGKFLRHVIDSENPALPFSHFETTIPLKSGASGGPVFDERGRVIGINCRGWDFGPDTSPDDNLSYVLPISALRPLTIRYPQVPPISWEYDSMSKLARTPPTIQDLISCGHIRTQ